jgi:hypothetical protein
MEKQTPLLTSMAYNVILDTIDSDISLEQYIVLEKLMDYGISNTLEDVFIEKYHVAYDCLNSCNSFEEAKELLLNKYLKI